MTDDRQLDNKSRELLRAIDEVRSLERQKRATRRSSPEFQELADAVERGSRRVFEIAAEEHAMAELDSPRDNEREDGSPGDWARHRDN